MRVLSVLFDAVTLVVLVSVVLSWIDPQGRWAISRILHQMTEPLLAPIRRLLPPMGGLDFSPMVLLLLIYLLRGLLGV